MGNRFTYSRWDGTQKGFDVDADSLFEQINDDLIYHGDVNAALRRLMNQGFRDRNGDQVKGLQEMLKKLREQRKEKLDRFDLGGIYNEIAEELNDIVDEERLGIEQALRDANNSDDPRRRDNAEAAAMDRNFRLDTLPDDLAGKVRELQSYDFASKDAQQRFDNLMDRLREQLMKQTFENVSESMRNMTPEDMQRMKEMMAALNEMIEKRNRGEDPGFEEFMEKYGDFFPDNPQSLDELLENLAQQMAAAQQVFNSMTPEQRDQLRQLSEQLLGDMDLANEMQQLSQNMQAMFPQMGWEQGRDFNGSEPANFEQAMDAMKEISDLDAMEQMMRQASTPSQLDEVDLDRVRDLLGDDAAASLERLAQLTKTLKEQGLIEQRDGRLELTPKGMRRIGADALRDLFAKLQKDKAGQHQMERNGSGHDRNFETKQYEYGDPFRIDLQRTIMNALRRETGTPVRLQQDDFEIERTEHLTQTSTVLLLDLSMSMELNDRLLPAKKVAIALQSLITSQFPRDYLGIIGFSYTAYPLKPDELIAAKCDYYQGTNMHHALTMARKLLARETGTKQIIMVTDGEPTAHVMDNAGIYFNWPPVPATLEATMKEVLRCTKEGITINTFMIDADHGLIRFVEQLTRVNRGRAFFTDSANLGDYVLVDFLEGRRQTSSRRRAS
jgi:uncharacterized protein with von Willebrand factor type A (vWA) domain